MSLCSYKDQNRDNSWSLNESPVASIEKQGLSSSQCAFPSTVLRDIDLPNTICDHSTYRLILRSFLSPLDYSNAKDLEHRYVISLLYVTAVVYVSSDANGVFGAGDTFVLSTLSSQNLLEIILKYLLYYPEMDIRSKLSERVRYLLRSFCFWIAA